MAARGQVGHGAHEPADCAAARAGSAGAVFCDASGDLVAPDDSLFFIQMPTTLPLAKATAKAASTDEDEPMEDAEASKDQAKESKKADESVYVSAAEIAECVVRVDLTVVLLCNDRDDGVFDHSIETAPGGFIGKVRHELLRLRWLYRDLTLRPLLYRSAFTSLAKWC